MAVSKHWAEFEDWGVVSEAFLPKFFHQLDGDERDSVLASVAFHAFLDHGAKEVGDAAEPKLGGVVPGHFGFFRRVEGDFDALAAFGCVEAPLVFVEPVAVIHVGARPATAANVGILAIAALPLELRIDRKST